jgi:predicted AAA+ superfamily ATPase
MNHETRTFETRGPVYPEHNYVVSRKKEIADLINWIERGRYIVISAPRQTGKTTFFKRVLEKLADEPHETYLPIQLDFEIYTDADMEEFYADVQRQIYR